MFKKPLIRDCRNCAYLDFVTSDTRGWKFYHCLKRDCIVENEPAELCRFWEDRNKTIVTKKKGGEKE